LESEAPLQKQYEAAEAERRQVKGFGPNLITDYSKPHILYRLGFL